MGVLNVTPDSFYKGSRAGDVEELIPRAERMLTEGATILDIGGHSTRPGAEQVTASEEIQRVVPAIQNIIKSFPEAIISIDTYRSDVAKAALDEGALIINDISGGQLDEKMFPLVIESKAPIILGHLKGRFETMMTETDYSDLITEVMDYFNEKINYLKSSGVNDIVIDPGFGFSKTLEQNFQLLKNMGYFINLGMPILAGISRKSMIYKLLGTTPDDALNGTTALNTVALMNGASILRVHDVKEAVEVVKLFNKIYA